MTKEGKELSPEQIEAIKEFAYQGILAALDTQIRWTKVQIPFTNGEYFVRLLKEELDDLTLRREQVLAFARRLRFFDVDSLITFCRIIAEAGTLSDEYPFPCIDFITKDFYEYVTGLGINLPPLSDWWVLLFPETWEFYGAIRN